MMGIRPGGLPQGAISFRPRPPRSNRAHAGPRELQATAYVERLKRTLGHAGRAEPFRYCCVGLLLVRAEPRVGGRPQEPAARKRRICQGITWMRSDDAMLTAMRRQMIPASNGRCR